MKGKHRILLRMSCDGFLPTHNASLIYVGHSFSLLQNLIRHGTGYLNTDFLPSSSVLSRITYCANFMSLPSHHSLSSSHSTLYNIYSW